MPEHFYRNYDCLKKADLGVKKPFVNFIACSVERSLDLYLEALEPAEKNNKLMTLLDVAKGTPYSQEYLSLLARQGKIGAVKISRNWMISKDGMRKYIEKTGKK